MKRPNPYIDLPLTFERIAAMTLSATVYIAQLVYGSLRGFFWFTLGKKTDEKRKRFHETMWRYFNFDVKYHPWLYADIRNPYGETFERGSILICNHQSLLDTLCLLILSPKILIVTHDKVWNNPFVAAVLRYADFFSVSDTGWEGRVDYCKSFIDKGYSIVIFPEGRRSPEGNIQRFHKGAFYLAEKLQADILPVFIHGAAHVQPVGCAWANRGGFHIEIQKRISPTDTSFGVGYVERCKRLHTYYERHFEEIRYEVETPDYFRHLVVELYASIGLRKEAVGVLDGKIGDQWHIQGLIDALVHPEKEIRLPQSSPLRRLYDKYSHLPENILFV